MIKHVLATVLLATCTIATSTEAAEYDYVIVGSGPGGGSLAYVIVLNGNVFSYSPY